MVKRAPDVIAGMLAARDREAAGPTAPAHGLYLQWIRFRPAPAPSESLSHPDPPAA
jgi:tRNA U38,U39,U40 pseudouridine synthase TruA